MLETSKLWHEVVDEVAKDYPDVTLEHMLVDRAAMELIAHPAGIDVMLTGNLFGDILSDEASMLAGSMGVVAVRESRWGRRALRAGARLGARYRG